MKSYSEIFKMAETCTEEVKNTTDPAVMYYLEGVLTALEWIRELKTDKQLTLDE